MQISVDEVSRLLAFTSTDRAGNRQAASAQLTGNDAQSHEAARVEVSNTAQEVQQIKKMVNRLPDTREDRVQALKAQIESGTYNVSGEAIADLMIRRVLADNTSL